MANSMRARVRMLLGKWGGWTVLMERLRREQAAARAWAEQEPGPLPCELLSKIDGEIDDLARLRTVLGALIAELSFEEQQILLLRYEEGMSWIRIAFRLNYDERSVRRLETQAVDKIARGLAPSGTALPALRQNKENPDLR